MTTHTAAHFGPLIGPKASRPPSASNPHHTHENVTGWLASQTNMLSDDWEILD